MPNRKRKSTNLHVPEGFKNLQSEAATALSKFTHFDLNINGGPPDNGQFSITVDPEGTAAAKTANLNWNAIPSEVSDAINGFGFDRLEVKATGSQLPDHTIKISVLNEPVPGFTMTAADDSLNNGAVPDLTGGSATVVAKEWQWSTEDVWRDKSNGRPLMKTMSSMSVSARDNGKWEITYKAFSLVRRHRWVYKLDAYSIDDELLFTLIPNATDHPTGKHVINQHGVSRDLRGAYDFVEYWVRRGAGEYRD